MKKKSSENDQLTGHFQSFFYFILPLIWKKVPANQLIKKFWPKFLTTLSSERPF